MYKNIFSKHLRKYFQNIPLFFKDTFNYDKDDDMYQKIYFMSTNLLSYIYSFFILLCIFIELFINLQ